MKRFVIISTFLLPSLAFAAADPKNSYLGRTIIAVGGIINTLLTLMVGIALVLFFWGMAKYITSAGSKEKIDEGRNLIMWGIITLFVMVSVWGIVGLIQKMFNFNSSNSNTTSTLNTGNVPPVVSTPSQECYYDAILKRNICTTIR